jgi:hypothetical protein
MTLPLFPDAGEALGDQHPGRVDGRAGGGQRLQEDPDPGRLAGAGGVVDVVAVLDGRGAGRRVGGDLPAMLQLGVMQPPGRPPS